MKIAYIIPGSGNTFYCENCMRDLDIVRAMRALGHEVIIVPMYLPLFSEYGEMDGTLPVFYGAVNVYLKYKVPLLRRAPEWITRIFDASPLLNAAAKRAGSTRAATLGDMTLSLLRGEDGEHAGELKRMVHRLKHDVRPDIVHLSNALLLGLVGYTKKELRLPVVCSLQDEHTWVDPMKREHRESVWEMMTERARDVDAFFPVSRYYGEVMMSRMEISRERLHVAYIGLDVADYTPVRPSFDPPVIGFLSRISESQGMGLLAEAYVNLKKEDTLRETRLHISGGQTGDDRPFIRSVMKRFNSRGVIEDVKIFEEFDRDSRIRFLSSLTLLSVPALSEHAFGSYVIEALALGIPVVQPALGAFPELIQETGGGIVYSPNDVDTLTSALRSLLCDHKRAAALGKKGSRAVGEKFSLNKTAERILKVYESLLL
jgi:glycosyltransferase involved in cell wall biosynthesis